MDADGTCRTTIFRIIEYRPAGAGIAKLSRPKPADLSTLRLVKCRVPSRFAELPVRGGTSLICFPSVGHLVTTVFGVCADTRLASDSVAASW